MSKKIKPLVTEAEHEQGWTDIDLETRSGRTIKVRLTAPSSMRGLDIGQRIQETGDVTEVIPLCWPEDLDPEIWKRKLDPTEAARLVNVCFCLVFGAAGEKKILALLRMAQTSGRSTADASPNSSAPDSPTPESGASPSSAPGSPQSEESNSTQCS